MEPLIVEQTELSRIVHLMHHHPSRDGFITSTLTKYTAVQRRWAQSFLSLPRVDQLQEIRKVTMGSLICANMDNIFSVQPEAFLRSDPYL